MGRSTSTDTAAVTRGRRGRAARESIPLGSLTQNENRSGVVCAACGSAHVTRLVMNLTDGTPVDFTSCHRCEERRWEHAGTQLSVESVLQRTRKNG